MSASAREPSVVVGYSGLHGAAAMRARQIGPDTPADLGFFQGQDAAAALLLDGRLVAAVQQERFSRKKFDGDFPVEAIRWCLEDAGVEECDVTAIAHNFDYGPYATRAEGEPRLSRLYRRVYAPRVQAELVKAHFPSLRNGVGVTPVRHHLAHAWAAVSAAGFEDAAVLIVDGMGELESISIYGWRGHELRLLRALGLQSSLGLFYSMITRHLGFLPSRDEYKVMGLAPYGDPGRFERAMGEAVQTSDGGVRVPILSWADGEDRYVQTRTWLESRLGPPRRVGESLTRTHHDIAAAAQVRLQDALTHLVDVAIDLTGSRRLVVGGGVALNCSAIGFIAYEHAGLDAIFVPPAPSDEGTAVGAAVAVHRDPGIALWPAMPLLGPLAGRPRHGRRPDRELEKSEVPRVIAQMLVEGAVVGWVQGRLEFGPRALGNRSILAAPTSRDLRDRVNAMIKQRENFRPLAPAVLAEEFANWFQPVAGVNLRHMTTTVRVRPHRREMISGVVHVDGTSRVQLVHRDEHPQFWALLRAYARASGGVPMVLNTSLNLRGSPIASSADDAFAVFRQSSLDALVIGSSVWLNENPKQLTPTPISEGSI